MESFKWWHVFRFLDLYEKMTYFFAKRWLDKTFGEREYWGSFIGELIFYANICVDCGNPMKEHEPQCQDCRIQS
jgi:hypothetical protein